MRVIDYAPEVINALQRAPSSGELTQTQLTEMVWGTSGHNAPKLVALLRYMVETNTIGCRQVGRTKLFRLI